MHKQIRAALTVLALAVATSATADAQALNDATIVGIFDAANSWDISTGAIAATKGASAEVRNFGEMLARDHQTVRGQGRDLATKLGVTPPQVARDFALRVNYVAAMKKLSALDGKEFDRAFLEYEIAYHKAVIDAVTNSFLPAIKNAELKAFVEKVAPAFVGHMQAAEALLKKQM